ncbi:ribose-phosphate pyrophosphokinase [Pelagibacteraceae bacterium]|jgi:ribose-phosphate pyrophosphokinase|nr:ribose-phosphate pyrophosphokinase [Pelagibacteraceae bacterium]
MKILSGTSNPRLSKEISKKLKLKLINTNIKRFADGEIYIEINENIRGNSVFVVQSTSTPANDNIMELLLCIDALRRSSAKNITAVIPYFGYARQDRKVAPRTSISAKVVSNLITNAGANRIVTVDLHAGQIQGFFDIPVDNLFTTPLFAKYIKKKFKSKNLVCVSPDIGGVQRTRGLATKIKADLAIIDKRRPAPGKSQVMNIIGEVRGKNCIIVDDIIDSGGTIVNAVEALKKAGAIDVYVFITHAVLSGDAAKKIQKSKIKKLIITDTIDNSSKIKNNSKIEVISIAPLMSEAINRISNSTSVSDLFN